MASLRAYLEGQLAGWRDDLVVPWQSFFEGVEPDFAAIGSQFTYDPNLPMIPPRRIFPLEGAPEGAHVFRAFEGLTPQQVQVVVIGQDPYPNKARATGRAFEDGALVDWGGAVAVSLKSIVQSTLAMRLDEPQLNASKAAWSEIRARVRSGELQLERIGIWFDRLQAQEGVLFVNAGWTLTRFVSGASDEQKAHIAMWAPLMQRLLRGLAERDRPTVFLLLGNFARDLFAAAGVEAVARARGTWEAKVQSVQHPHPNAPGYFAAGNPLAKVNQQLEEMGASGVRW